MRTDESVPAGAAVASDLYVDLDGVREKIAELRRCAAELRQNAQWGATANSGLVGANGSFSSLVGFGVACGQLDQCSQKVADQMDYQAAELEKYMDKGKENMAMYGRRLRDV
jgi:hypothetical protein